MMVAENWPEGPAHGTNLSMKYIKPGLGKHWSGAVREGRDFISSATMSPSKEESTNLPLPWIHPYAYMVATSRNAAGKLYLIKCGNFSSLSNFIGLFKLHFN